MNLPLLDGNYFSKGVKRAIDELILYHAPKLLGKDRNTFSKFGQNNQKLSTIGFTIGDMENLGEDLKITLTQNKNNEAK